MKTAFICDSTLQVKEEFCEKYPLTVVPLEVRLDDEVYEDNVTIKPEEFFVKISNGMKPSTSQPSVGKILEVLENLKKEGYERVVAFSVSEKLSGTYSSFNQARELAEGLEVKLINTEQVARLAGRAVEKIVRDYENGKLEYEDIEETFADLRDKQNVLVTVENMDFLYAGGRLSKTQFFLSNMLNILPIITLKDGELAVTGKQRGMKKVIAKICEEIKEKNPKSLVLLHTNSEDLLEKVHSELVATFGDIPIEVELISPVIGTHAGPRAFAIAYLQYED